MSWAIAKRRTNHPVEFQMISLQTLIDKEQQEATVQASFIQAAPHMQTPADLRSYMAEQLFIDALNTRFFRLSRKADPAFFGATAYASPLCRASQASAVLASVSESGHLAGLEVNPR